MGLGLVVRRGGAECGLVARLGDGAKALRAGGASDDCERRHAGG